MTRPRLPARLRHRYRDGSFVCGDVASLDVTHVHLRCSRCHRLVGTAPFYDDGTQELDDDGPAEEWLFCIGCRDKEDAHGPEAH